MKNVQMWQPTRVEGSEGKGREGKGREGKGREGKGMPFGFNLMRSQVLYRAAQGIRASN